MSTPVLDVGPGIRSIYSDLVNLPDPVYLGLTVRIFNYDDVTLYMRVDGYKTGWTFTSNNLGALASGANMYRNLDNFGSRAKPAVETTETITVRLRAYTDSGYTNLKWTFERVITLVFIKSDDGSWTQDFLDNFDDGTVDGWAASAEVGAAPSLGVGTDYVLSAPYSLKMNQNVAGLSEGKVRVYKSFTTPNRNKVYAIINARAGGDVILKNMQVQRDGTVLIFLGRPYNTSVTHDYPRNKWIRTVALLPKNATVEIRLVYDCYNADSPARAHTTWMDDFTIISKD